MTAYDEFTAAIAEYLAEIVVWGEPQHPAPAILRGADGRYRYGSARPGETVVVDLDADPLVCHWVRAAAALNAAAATAAAQLWNTMRIADHAE